MKRSAKSKEEMHCKRGKIRDRNLCLEAFIHWSNINNIQCSDKVGYYVLKPLINVRQVVIIFTQRRFAI